MSERAERTLRTTLPRLRWPRAGGGGGVRVACLLALAACMAATPGFFSRVSLFSLLTNLSFTGCVAIGMTFITLSGNIMSFSLGATVSTATIVFVSALPLGLFAAAALAVLFGAAVSGLQGWVVGYFGANPIIVSLAGLSLVVGSFTLITGGHGVYPEGSETDALSQPIGIIPLPLVAFALAGVAGQLLLSFTRFGRELYMVGSNPRAARAAGLTPWRTITLAYAVAGGFSAVAAVLISARYGSGDMELGATYDYPAISAVLVGGTAIGGGAGSVLRTLVGALIIAVCEGLLLLNGFSTPVQYLAIGVIVLGVILLQARGER